MSISLSLCETKKILLILLMAVHCDVSVAKIFLRVSVYVHEGPKIGIQKTLMFTAVKVKAAI